MSDFESQDFYELLGVERSASADEIKRAYRREISKYHPDRFVTASPEQQAYGQLRSQRLTEAYATLSDFAARSAYNRGEGARKPSRLQRTEPVESAPRDYQAELYAQATEHLAAGRALQAVGVLRQLQQINPFYRDSAALLARAEAQTQTPTQTRRKRGIALPLLVGGGVVGVAAVGLVAWGLAQRPRATTGAEEPTSVTIAVVATSVPTEVSVPTAAPVVEPTDAPAPIAEPTVAPQATSEPTAEPTLAPTAGPLAERGQVLLGDQFNQGDWAALSGAGWNVGFQEERYRIAVNPGTGVIWSYRAGPGSNVSIGVDTQVRSGEGGLLLRFADERNYFTYSINSQTSSYSVVQHLGGTVTTLSSGQNSAIVAGADAQNRIVARLDGGTMEVYANNQLLATIDISGAPTSSRYGLLAIGGTSASEVLFDNLEIRALR